MDLNDSDHAKCWWEEGGGMSAGREDEATGSASRDVDDERSQSSGRSPSTASVGQQPQSTATVSFPLRMLRVCATQRQTAQLAGS